MKNKLLPILIVAIALLCALLPLSAQKIAFSNVPRSHWIYPVLPRLVKAKLVEYPNHTDLRKPLAFTRFELAVMTIRAKEKVKSLTKLTAKQTRLLPMIKRMTREFAPEMKQLGH